MQFTSFSCGFLLNEAYLVWDGSTAVLFDAPQGSYTVVSEFLTQNNLELKTIVLTHSHFDHIIDLKKFQSNYKIKIYVHLADEYRLLNPMEHLPQGMPFVMDKIEVDEYVNDEQILIFGNIKLKIIHTPGHTKGGVCIEIIGEKKIITGDTLFRAGIGRSDFTGGDFEEIEHSIREKLYCYPDDYEIFPGHGASSSIGFEKRHNPYVKFISS
jgi:glyoxylase-like metal-dependent hydrolase (beta-lactamase superfamily II)